MKFLAAVQARFGSSRLPGKILMDLYGKPALERVIGRAEKSMHVEEAVVLTSINKDDIKTVHHVSGMGRRVIAGSPDDVLSRYYQAAKLFEPEYIIRITADCPVFDAKLLDDAIAKLDAHADYMADMGGTLADGLDFEIIRTEALIDAWENAKLMSEREHVTLYIKNHPEQFKLQNYSCPLGNIGSRRWTLDEPEDYMLLTAIYDHFKDAEFYTEELLAFLDANPALEKVNQNIGRNEGLAKSLENDFEIIKEGKK